MFAPDPPAITPDHVRERLRRGRPVQLDEPGWADTGAGPCPKCGRACHQFRAEPDLRFHYGETCAYPHVCGELGEPRLVPDMLRRRDLDEQHQNAMYRANEWPPEPGSPLDNAARWRERE